MSTIQLIINFKFKKQSILNLFCITVKRIADTVGEINYCP